jgi:hypothetical protein
MDSIILLNRARAAGLAGGSVSNDLDVAMSFRRLGADSGHVGALAGVQLGRVGLE